MDRTSGASSQGPPKPTAVPKTGKGDSSQESLVYTAEADHPGPLGTYNETCPLSPWAHTVGHDQ